MKKVRLSIAALTLIVAIAGTTTANANRKSAPTLPCSVVDPGGTLCPDASDVDCCDDNGRPVHAPKPI